LKSITLAITIPRQFTFLIFFIIIHH
jgi:hypothetical protein